MEPRIDLLANEVGARISKRIYNVSLAIDQSSLPKATQELVIAARQPDQRLRLVRRHPHQGGRGRRRDRGPAATWSPPGATPRCSPRPNGPHWRSPRRAPGWPTPAHGVSDETWAQVREHYDDDQIAALVSLVALINATNRLSVIANYQGGSYQPGMFDSMAS